MADKPKLTVEAARKEFPEECWEIATGHVNIQKWTHDGKQYMQRWLCQLGTTCKLDRRDLIAAAVEWLEGKELVGLGPTTSHRRFMPKDSLRWALEEVKEQLKLEKSDPDRAGQCWCCANNFPGCCPYEGDEFSPTPCDKWADAPRVTRLSTPDEGGQ